MKLTKDQIRLVLDDNSIRHTEACRSIPGNKKNTGSHNPQERHKWDLGGYRCICDWMERIKTAYEKLNSPLELYSPQPHHTE
jgi:hypothetical protein